MNGGAEINLGLIVYISGTLLLGCTGLCWWLIWSPVGTRHPIGWVTLCFTWVPGTLFPKLTQFWSGSWGGRLAPLELAGGTNIRTWLTLFRIYFIQLYMLYGCTLYGPLRCVFMYMMFWILSTMEIFNKPIWNRISVFISSSANPPLIQTWSKIMPQWVKILIHSDHNLAHTKAAQLSWHVQNYDLTWSIE